MRVHDHLGHARFRLGIEDIFGAGDRAVVRLRMPDTHTGAPLSSSGLPNCEPKNRFASFFFLASLHCGQPDPYQTTTVHYFWP